MSNQTSGSLHFKGQTTVVSDKFTKREFVIVTKDQYPQYLSFQLTQDKVSLLDPVNVGDDIVVNFNLRGREWINPQGEKKYFNSLECWSLSHTLNGAGKEPYKAPASDHIPDSSDVPF